AVQFLEKLLGCPAMFKKEKLQSCLLTALAQHVAGAKDLRHAARGGDDLLRTDEGVQTDAKVRMRGKSAGHAQRESNFHVAAALPRDRSETNVVDFRIRAPVAAASDGHLELARQIVKRSLAG